MALGIKGILERNERNGITYNTKKIVQSSDLKEKLEKLALQKETSTIISLDIVNM